MIQQGTTVTKKSDSGANPLQHGIQIALEYFPFVFLLPLHGVLGIHLHFFVSFLVLSVWAVCPGRLGRMAGMCIRTVIELIVIEPDLPPTLLFLLEPRAKKEEYTIETSDTSMKLTIVQKLMVLSQSHIRLAECGDNIHDVDPGLPKNNNHWSRYKNKVGRYEGSLTGPRFQERPANDSVQESRQVTSRPFIQTPSAKAYEWPLQKASQAT